MKTSGFFGLAVCAVLLIGLTPSIDRGRGSKSKGNVPPPLHALGSVATNGPRMREALAAQPRIAAAYGKLPLSFEANRGQADSRVKFLSRGRGYSLLLTSAEAILTLGRATGKTVTRRPSARSLAAGRTEPLPLEQESSLRKPTSLRMSLTRANPAAIVTGLGELPGKANYFLGSDPKTWRTNVPTYGRVKYQNVYPGVDLIYYGNQQDLETDFVVAPGANPEAIRLKFRGTTSIKINSDGDLVLKIPDGKSILRKPVAYQLSSTTELPPIDATRHSVSARYVLKSTREVAFAVESYDIRAPLIIDPVLAYSTYLGGGGTEFAIGGIAVDAAGNAYVAGLTNSTDFPTVNPFQNTCSACSNGDSPGDAFVSKLNAAGNALVYSTYLGGSAGTQAQSIAVDAAGNAYIAGATVSTDFPTVNAFQSTCINCGIGHAIVAKLNPTGDALVYSTYLGGSNSDIAFGIALDTGGNAYVTGETFSKDFPTMNTFQSTCGGCAAGFSDAFVTKFNLAGNALVYSSYLGGGVGSPFTPPYSEGHAIAVDATGNAYVTGLTASTDFPTMNPFQSTCAGCPSGFPDAFVTKFTAAGDALGYSTYLGGNIPGEQGLSSSVGSGIAVDAVGSSYVTGLTYSANFPTANAFQSTLHGFTDTFVTKFKASGNGVVYSTYLGGNCFDTPGGIAVDSAGNAYVAGGTCSADFPVANAFQSTCATHAPFPCDSDAFVTEFNAAGNALVYSSYLGGSNGNAAFGIAVDTAGNAYLAGTTSSTDFPAVNPVQATYGGGVQDDFVAKISPTADFTIASSAVSQTISAGQTATYPLTLVGSNGFTGTVSLTCIGAPQGSNCSISPNPVNVSGTNASNATVTVSSTARPSSSADMIQGFLFRSPRLWAALGFIPAFACLFIGAPRRQRSGLHQRAWPGITVVLLFAVLSFGCGGGSATKTGTAAGSYTLTVTGASGSLTHTINLTLKVN
jgi:hypothetical protein